MEEAVEILGQYSQTHSMKALAGTDSVELADFVIYFRAIGRFLQLLVLLYYFHLKG